MRIINGNIKLLSIIVVFVLLAAVFFAGSNLPTTAAYTTDIETASNNGFQGWSPGLWTQTSQADFEAGVTNQVNTTSIPGDVFLAEEYSQTVVASDDLESGDWSGGTGWLWDWYTENSPTVTSGGTPYEGSYHIQMTPSGSYQYIARPTDMTGMANARVRFWAKADSFASSDFVNCTIFDSTTWNTVYTWVDGDDDDTYHYFDIDVSGMIMSGVFYVTFYTEGTDANFYIDNIQFAGTPVSSVIATDDFESSGWDGGTGWLWEWYDGGDSNVTTNGEPHSGSYHVRLCRSTGYIDRAVDLSGKSNVRLQFWAKADSFESGDFAECLVHDGTGWYVVKTWIDGEDDNIYRFYDINLSGYNMSDQFYIAFDAEMGNGDNLYIDDVVFKTVDVYYTSGTLASQVLDTGTAGSIWNMLFWDETLQSNTDITLEVRASDTIFSAGDAAPSWNSVGGTSPVMSGLPSGRYMQWRVTFTTTDTGNTPTLHEVRLYYY